jgi:two-component system cell cycle sensor histidine kinase/response regulator CckA
MAAGIAHDFNNLLTAIMGAADAIVTRPGIDPETLEEAGHIQNGAERGAALVRQLLAFSRPQALQPRGLAVNPVMTAMAGMLRRLLGETIKLELDLETPGRAIMIDPTQLDQVLLNLAVNARDAMPEGGVLTLRSGHLALYRARPNGGETIPPNRYVTIEVSDTGTGIPPELLPRIFDPFFTTKQDKNGTGLGLASVRDIVGHAGGYLTVESVLGQGTRLRLLFPRWDGTLDALPATAAPAPIAATVPGRVVLLVEDEEPVRRLAARSFERRGWTVLSAASGEAALSLLATEDRPISAIVSDMVLQGMDGAALVRAVRDQPGHANVPAVLVSGYAEAVVRRETADVATAFIAKPYLPRDLVSRVETILDNNTAPPV